MRLTRKSAFTLIEVIVVMAILALLASILFPVFLKAKSQAKIPVCYQNLRSLHILLSLYREEHGGSDAPGKTVEMGLPDGFDDMKPDTFGVHAHLYCASSQSHPDGATERAGFVRMWPFYSPIANIDPAVLEDMQRDWVRYVESVEGNPVVYVDPNHQDSWPVSRISLQKAFGITLNGSLIKKTSRGSPSEIHFWMD